MVLATSANPRQASNDANNDGRSKNSEAYCERLALNLNTVKELPVSCRQYEGIVQKLETKEKESADPFAGMWAGSAAKARSSRAQGREHHAKIQRRLTTGATSTRRFSKLEEK
ncbi:predicted protein [Phaeodactylum tricornutum CCAP 1055/1]|uniref:Uncharacterized protein n=2 Tax=Phaeodactylum tricornutum TaxID=2850 RepID=B7G6B0_PHATC|nr:predicted protein [Phaeodactylum tricornutum CCAP 1055/1]EEC45830.1 predicted protein [Phaeodactylum tricornutum CCAP 1055/1]|mmetsp:Transcript_20579/g.52303  ORF Transcript_20579/g.52303 Transcript_20579/m.52303 type:complete len:113 (+) Transcript_20579:77-415(+)|eukprot:XP_002182543.1 predicted protein [Phaeodactylum tricornutum CCAP 1055/1]